MDKIQFGEGNACVYGERKIFSRFKKLSGGRKNTVLLRRQIIGIIGADSGVGTTFVAVTISAYLADRRGKKTVLLSAGGHQAEEMDIGKGKFRYESYVKLEELPARCNGEEEYYIVELGCDYERARLDFLRCDRKIVVGSWTPWKKPSYGRLMDKIVIEDNYKQWIDCLILFGDKKDKKEFSKRYNVAVNSIPYIDDPLRIGENEADFIEKLSLL